MKNILIIFLLLICAHCARSQTILDWEKCYGGGRWDRMPNILPTADGGFVFSGYTSSDDGDVTGLHTPVLGSSDYWVVKINSTGAIEWQRALGGDMMEYTGNVIQTMDGGYITVGTASSTNGDVTHPLGYEDIWVVKLTPTGGIDWQRNYGGSADDRGNYISQTFDSGYIIGGSTKSGDGDALGHLSFGEDLFVLKISKTGAVQWKKFYGGSGAEYVEKIRQVADTGFIISAATVSPDGDVVGAHGSWDAWILKLDPAGDTVWTKCIGGSDFDYIHDIRQTTDLGYIATGIGYSTDGDLAGGHGGSEGIIMKLNASGGTVWKKIVGGLNIDGFYSVVQTHEGGYLTVGTSASTNGDLTSVNHIGMTDVWLSKFTAAGLLQWQRRYASDGQDEGMCIEKKVDGGYVIAGETLAGGGVTGFHAGVDIWIATFDTCALTDPVITMSSGILNASSGYDTYQWSNAVGNIAGATNSTYAPSVDGVYKVTGNNTTDNCSATSEGYSFSLAVGSVGVAMPFAIYPNPARVADAIRIPTECNITIVNAYGQVMYQQNNVDEIKLNMLSTGIYYLKAEMKDGSVSFASLSLY